MNKKIGNSLFYSVFGTYVTYTYNSNSQLCMITCN